MDATAQRGQNDQAGVPNLGRAQASVGQSLTTKHTKVAALSLIIAQS